MKSATLFVWILSRARKQTSDQENARTRQTHKMRYCSQRLLIYSQTLWKMIKLPLVIENQQTKWNNNGGKWTQKTTTTKTKRLQEQWKPTI